jgi:biotin/methionine sulfoxide reductase
MVSVAEQQRRSVHLTHWGAAEIESDGRRLTSVRPWREDPAPSRILENLAAAHHHPARVDQPYVRRGWLEHGPGAAARGSDVFVPVSWEAALDLLAAELRRVYGRYGVYGVYGGSYGWASAGRFHHAQSQLHRFLNGLGGYVRSVNNYSFGTSSVLLPHVVGDVGLVMEGATAWSVLAGHTDLVVAFGGLSPKNSAVAAGGIGRHTMAAALAAAVARGCRLVSVSPLRTDIDAHLGAEWIAPAPGTDAALMLALAHVLDAEGLADRCFLDRYTVGYPRFAGYLRGDRDGVPKTPAWAAALTGVAADRIRALARQLTAGRTMITVSWSLQRAEHGEQPVWLGLVLAAMLGQIGLPGGGFGHGYGSTGDIGNPRRMPAPRLSQGANGIDSYIPVARIADMLLHPGDSYDYDGQRRRYPDVKCVYWAGGNPFHHHQDLARLRRAFARPQTVVVHDPFWTATARHADIVLPGTMTVERDDIGVGGRDSTLFAMPQLVEPYAQARDDYAVFAALAERLQVAAAFTEGRTAGQWLRHLYGGWRSELRAAGHERPPFEQFWAAGSVEIPVPDPGQVLLSAFRRDPAGSALATPSGKIEIFSAAIDGFGYADCPGHPVWLEPAEWLGRHPRGYPLQLVANQPRRRLHSQLDVGAYSQEGKIRGREPAAMHPGDAAARGIADGSCVRIFNDRGSCLAGVALTEDVRPGVVQLSTGAWYDPDPADPSFCRHGNPNVLTADRPSSALSQGTTGQLAMVQVEPYDGVPPEVSVHRPPATAELLGPGGGQRQQPEPPAPSRRIGPLAAHDVVQRVADLPERHHDQNQHDQRRIDLPPVAVEQVVDPVGQHRAPVGERRRRPDAEEAQRRQRVDRVRDGKGRRDHADAERVRDHVPGQDPPVAGAHRPGRLDELPRPQREDLTADQPGGIRPRQHGQDRDDDREAEREHAGHDDQQDEGGHGQHGVDDAHHEGVHDPADHSGDRAVEQADQGGRDADGETELERRLAAGHQPAEHVDPVLVGAQRVTGPRRAVLDGQAHRDLVGVVEQRAHEAEQGQQHDDAGPGHGPSVLQQRPQAELGAGGGGDLAAFGRQGTARRGRISRGGRGVRCGHSGSSGRACRRRRRRPGCRARWPRR